MCVVFSISFQFIGSFLLGFSIIGVSNRKIFSSSSSILGIHEDKAYMLVQQFKERKKIQILSSVGITYIFIGLILSLIESTTKVSYNMFYFVLLSLILILLTLLIVEKGVKITYRHYQKYIPVNDNYIEQGRHALEITKEEINKYKKDFKL